MNAGGRWRETATRGPDKLVTRGRGAIRRSDEVDALSCARSTLTRADSIVSLSFRYSFSFRTARLSLSIRALIVRHRDDPQSSARVLCAHSARNPAAIALFHGESSGVRRPSLRLDDRFPFPRPRGRGGVRFDRRLGGWYKRRAKRPLVIGLFRSRDSRRQ